MLARYFAERVLGRPSPRHSRKLLEQQILDEVIALAARRPRTRRAHHTADTDIELDLRAAIDHIEAHLFDPFDLRAVAVAAAVSASTLARRFREIGVTPAEYARNRRLDEARALLERGEHAVGDIALLVGYDEPSAFGRAFRRRFGHSPKRVSVQRRTRNGREW